jgi:hypothetical protein
MACDGPGDATDHRNDNDDDVTPTRCCCFG